MTREFNFSVLRHLAAFFVFFAHGFEASGQLPMQLLGYFPFLIYTSTVGVAIFFIISGFLVTKSWFLKSTYSNFVINRLLRIYPGMLGCILFCMVFGVVFSTLNAELYFSNHQLWRYFIDNILLKNNLVLPGVFDNNPIKSIVTATFWTLPIEVTCYIFILLMGVFFRKYVYLWLMLLPIALIGAINYGGEINLFRAVFSPDNLPKYYACFIFGSFIYLLQLNFAFKFQSRLRFSLPLLAIFLIAANFLEYRFLFWVTLFWFAVFLIDFAAWVQCHWPENKSWDLSYGIYLYGFPIQQAVVYFFPEQNGWFNLLVAFPLTVAIAMCSWIWIERPALAWKSSIRFTQK